MKTLIYQVYVGAPSKLYDVCIDSVKQYANKYNIDHVIQTQPKLRIKPDVFATNRSVESYEKHGGFLPIYEKENAFEYFDQGYDRIAIIDADIYIRPDAPNIFDIMGNTPLSHGSCFAGVLECDMPLTQQYTQKIHGYSRMQYQSLAHQMSLQWNPSTGYPFYNMGMMLLDKSIVKYFNGNTPEQFIRRNEFKDFVDGQGAWKWSTDQTLLNYWLCKYDIPRQNLEWKWNALYKGVEDSAIKDAYFIHFFLRDKLPSRGEDIGSFIDTI
jgi:hypothetical protein